VTRPVAFVSLTCTNEWLLVIDGDDVEEVVVVLAVVVVAVFLAVVFFVAVSDITHSACKQSHQQEQQRVVVGPGNAHFISILQVSSDAATLQRGRCRHLFGAAATAATAAAGAAVCRQFDD